MEQRSDEPRKIQTREERLKLMPWCSEQVSAWWQTFGGLDDVVLRENNCIFEWHRGE